MSAVLNWIRPWYPAGRVGHIYSDCETLLRTETEPREGTGWLDPEQGLVCWDCRKRYDPALAEALSWDAACSTCDASLSEEDDSDGPFTEDDAKHWASEHECIPDTRVVPPATPSANKDAA